MKLLALDAATESCSVALLFGSQLIERTLESGKSHSQHLLSMTQELLGEAGIALNDLDGLAASVGPGAFTGVRVTVSVAQGLAYGANLPVVSVLSLEALALQALNASGERALCCLDARMNEVYFGCFQLEPDGEPLALFSPAVGPASAVHVPPGRECRGIGRGFSAYPQLRELPGVAVEGEAGQALPRAREVALLGSRRLKAGLGRDPADLQPVYLRDRVAFTEAERQKR